MIELAVHAIGFATAYRLLSSMFSPRRMIRCEESSK